MIEIISIDSINDLPMEIVERVENSIIYNIYGLNNAEPCFDILYKVSPKHYIFL